jgi:MFS family permease
MTDEADGVGGAPPSGDTGQRWLTRGIGGVALASFFSDAGHELTTSVLPSFVTVTLRSTAGALGLIEGISDGLLGVATLLAGPFANDPARRLRMASGGYLATAAATGAIGLAVTVWQAGLLRAAAWLSRGVRSPARDATLASLAPSRAYGRAFGLERLGDNIGAVAGPLLAAWLVGWLGIRPALYLAAIPGVFAALAITVAAREARRRTVDVAARTRLGTQLTELRAAGLTRALLPISAFELGNMATTLLILRATDLLQTEGHSVTRASSLAVLIYAAHNLVAGVVSYPSGHWVDRRGPLAPFVMATVTYIASYLLFGLDAGATATLVLAFLLAGCGIGLAETAESALVARVLPDGLRGSGFGLLGGVQAFGGFASSAAIGLLWSAVSPTVGFLYAAGWMAVSLALAVYSRSALSPEVS